MVVASGEVRLPRFLRREAGAEIDRLYRKHADEVLRYALLVLRSRTDAEDITQTVFLRALRAIERGEQVRTPRNWLIKITHNECRRLLATRKLHIELPDEIAVEPVEQGRAEELKLAMEALPAHQRQALVMRELEGRTYAEIAGMLDVSVSAVETLIFRARRALREQIENAMSCEEFAALLNDPSARSRVRAHARVCPECATLDHQSRGRKSALKRIASALGFPGWGTWWGAKLAAVAVTTATVTAVAVTVPHDPVRPSVPSVGTPSGLHPSAPASRQQQAAASGGATRLKAPVPAQAHRAPAAAPGHVSGTAPVPAAPAAAVTPPAAALPGPQPTPAPAPAPPETEPPSLPSPTKLVPAVPAVPALPLPEPAVTVPLPVLPPVPAVPTDAVPTVSVPGPAAALPTVTLPGELPNVSLP
jgi:RNA polymerase sigma factor (sigma-70 family)